MVRSVIRGDARLRRAGCARPVAERTDGLVPG